VTAEVIETKRSPPIWSVKAGHRYKAAFSGPDARTQAEEYAIMNYGGFTLREKPALARPRYAHEPATAK
jgi:hypothetical protein